MVKKTLTCFALIFLAIQIISFASAADTPITIKYAPDYNLRLGILNPYTADYSEYESFNEVFNENGEATIIYSSPNPSFGLMVFVSQDNNKILKERYPLGYLSGEKYTAGEPIELDFTPEWYKKMKEFSNSGTEQVVELEETNSTLEINESVLDNQTKEAEDDSAAISNFAVFGESGTSVLKIVVYIIGGLVILAIIIFITLRVIRSVKSRKIDDDEPRGIKIKKLSEMHTEKKESLEDYNDIIDDAEDKIRDALEAIEKLRKSDKMSEIKKRMIEDEKELMRLRKGE